MFLPLHRRRSAKNLKTPLATRLADRRLHRRVRSDASTRPIGADEMVAGFGLIPAVLFGSEILPAGLSLRACAS